MSYMPRSGGCEVLERACVIVNAEPDSLGGLMYRAVVVGSIVAATLAGGAPADSAESDRFAPMDGNDAVYANDTLYMADGNDSLAASDGNDSLGAPDGDDILHAPDGDVLGPGA
jgi:Ca2+-binding RTX toxin-like protein